MKLTVRDIAKLLKVPEETVYNWIDHDKLPVSKINDQYRINKTELMEWVSSRKIPIPAISTRTDKHPGALPLLSQALEKGGIVYGVKGENKEAILKAMVQIMKLPPEMDRENLFKILLAREDLASTGVGDGIAIPHVRNPIVIPINQATVTLCFLEKPIDFGALDKKPVHTLFTLLSPTINIHLYLISRISFALHDAHFKKLLQDRGTRDAILNCLREVEKNFETEPRQ